MATLDSVINMIAPWVIFAAGAYILYRPLAHIFNPLIEKAIGLFKKKDTDDNGGGEMFAEYSNIDFE